MSMFVFDSDIKNGILRNHVKDCTPIVRYIPQSAIQKTDKELIDSESSSIAKGRKKIELLIKKNNVFDIIKVYNFLDNAPNMISFNANTPSIDLFNQTLDEMKKGTTIIYRGVLIHENLCAFLGKKRFF